MISGSLDRALDVAATLEVRGFATAPRAPRSERPWSRHDVAFLASAGAVLALALAGRLGSALAFVAYPRLQAHLTPATLALSLAILPAVLFPFADRRGTEP